MESTNRMIRPRLPKSVVAAWQGWTGLIGLGIALAVQRSLRLSPGDAVLLIIILTAVPIVAWESTHALRKRRLRPRDGDHYRRVGFKLAALVQTWIVIAGVYWLVPFYADGPGALLLGIVSRPYVWPILLAIVPLYISLEDRTSAYPQDVLYRIGRRVAGLDAPLDNDEIREYLMGWAIKAFFLPIMISGCIDNIRWWTDYAPKQYGYFVVYEFLYSLLYFIDVVFASAGYIFALKLFDTQIRTSQPKLLGWIAALICYPPFWPGVSNTIFAYNPDGREWGQFFGHTPVLSHAWAFVMIVLVGIYAASTIQFGIRFSNLTNRGIITNGTYRWMKHPAYVSKNISWWMLSVPFLYHTGYLQSIRACALLLALNFIYVLRAKTEESHLSEEPAYREYLTFMAERSLYAVVRRRALLLAGRSEPLQPFPGVAAKKS